MQCISAVALEDSDAVMHRLRTNEEGVCENGIAIEKSSWNRKFEVRKKRDCGMTRETGMILSKEGSKEGMLHRVRSAGI